MHGHYWGIGVSSKAPGGEVLASAANILSEVAQVIAAWEQDQAVMVSKVASYERRADEWICSITLHNMSLYKRWANRYFVDCRTDCSSRVRKHPTIKNAQDVKQFLEDKFTDEDLYLWMQGRSRLLYEYRLAVDLARKAEHARHEAGLIRPRSGRPRLCKVQLLGRWPQRLAVRRSTLSGPQAPGASLSREQQARAGTYEACVVAPA